jgi:hypothetical protein
MLAVGRLRHRCRRESRLRDDDVVTVDGTTDGRYATASPDVVPALARMFAGAAPWSLPSRRRIPR